MTPTTKLRFVRRMFPNENNGLLLPKLILQQWWEGVGDIIEKQGSYSKIVQGRIGQWRDVPVEEE